MRQLLARLLGFVACMKKREDQVRRTTRDFRLRVAKCIEVGGGIFEHLLLLLLLLLLLSGTLGKF